MKEENKINDENSLEKIKITLWQKNKQKQTNKQTEQVFSLNFFLIVKVSTTPVIKGDDICEKVAFIRSLALSGGCHSGEEVHCWNVAFVKS